MGDDHADAWRRRYERERAARLEAEAIGERAIAELTATNRALDRRVVDRTKELEETLRRLEDSGRAKDTFLRGTAHELATPLHAIRGLVELIQGQSTDDEVRRIAREAGVAATRLHQALRNLVEFAAISNDEVTITVEQTTLGTYADGVASRWRMIAAREGKLLLVEVAPEPDTIVHLDPVRIDQIVDALLDNAIRHGATRVVLRLALLTTDTCPWLRLSVDDDGPGVDPADELDVFEAFVRRDTAGTSGFGVGLTLARAVAESLDGTLELVGSSDGARFEALMPAPTPRNAAS